MKTDAEQAAGGYHESCDMGDDGGPCDHCLTMRQLARDVLALVARVEQQERVVEAARDWREAEYECGRGSYKPNPDVVEAAEQAFWEALTGLDGQPE